MDSSEKISSSSGSPQLLTFFYVLFWMFQGISMILFNKILLTTWGFKFPFFLSMWHMIFATVITQFLAKTSMLLPSVREGKITVADYLRKFVPMSVLFAVSLVLSNSAYKYISVAFIQMLKSSTPVIVLLLSFTVGKEKPSLLQFSIILVISFGVILSTVGEVRFNLIGFFMQISATFCECTRSLMMDLILSNKKLDSLSMLYYVAPISSLFLSIGFLIFEFNDLAALQISYPLLAALFLNGCLSFSLNIAVILLVSHASVLVMSVCGPMKDMTLVLLSVMLFQTPVTSVQFYGFLTSMFGLYLFREFKSNNGSFPPICRFMLHCWFPLFVVKDNAGQSLEEHIAPEEGDGAIKTTSIMNIFDVESNDIREKITQQDGNLRIR